MQQFYIFGKVRFIDCYLKFFRNYLLVHNRVNQRLHGDSTEDPEHPKIQFPSKYLCSKCHSLNENDFNIANTIDFLVQYYSKENIDFSLSEEKASSIEIDNKSIEQYRSFRSIVSSIGHLHVYLFVWFVVMIIIIIVRRQYGNKKRKRYTL